MKIDPAFISLQGVSAGSWKPETSRVRVSGLDDVQQRTGDLFARQQAEPPMLKGRDLSALKKEAPPETDEPPQQQVPETSIQSGGPSRTGAAVESPSAIRTNGNGTLSVIEESGARQGQTDSGGINFAEIYGVNVDTASHLPQRFTSDEVERCYFKSSGPQGIGELSGEGMKLYEAVKAKYLDSVPVCPVGPPTIYLTGGLPGSGKGYVLSKIMQGKPQFVLVDPDEIKKDILRDIADKNPQLKGEMAQYNGWNDVVHETSSDMAKRLMSDALASGKDIVFDSSMASSNVGKYRDFAKRARAMGYQVNGIIADVSEETAITRAYQRADTPVRLNLKNGDTLSLHGRFTKPDYIRECSQNLHSNLSTYLQEGMYDRCVVFDNNSPDPKVSAAYEREKLPDGTFTMKRCTG
jgi:predicted kinase